MSTNRIAAIEDTTFCSKCGKYNPTPQYLKCPECRRRNIEYQKRFKERKAREVREASASQKAQVMPRRYCGAPQSRESEVYVSILRLANGKGARVSGMRPDGADALMCNYGDTYRVCEKCCEWEDGRCRLVGAKVVVTKPYKRLSAEGINLDGAMNLALAVVRRAARDVASGAVTASKAKWEIMHNPFITSVLDTEIIDRWFGRDV